MNYPNALLLLGLECVGAYLVIKGFPVLGGWICILTLFCFPGVVK